MNDKAVKCEKCRSTNVNCLETEEKGEDEKRLFGCVECGIFFEV